jgi:CshA-type fibril repeat protein
VPPVPGAARAKNDMKHGKTGQPVRVHPLVNDTPSKGATWKADTLRLIDPDTGLRVSTLVVAGEGTWTVDPGGSVTFTPEKGFSGDPTPVRYSVLDSNGHAVRATITIDYPTVHTGPGTPTGPGGSTTGGGTLPHTGTVALVGTIWLSSGGILIGTFLIAWGSRGGRRRRRHSGRLV